MTDERQADLERIDVSYVAHLARLHLTPEETARFQDQLQHIVGYVQKIKEVDLAGVEPMAHAVHIQNVFRPDAVKAGLSADEVLANAPARVQGQFQVPKIVE